MVFPSENDSLSPEQAMALELLRSGENVFLTGGAGSGKSHLIRYFQRELNPKEMPVLASTGAAAVLLGGRTFHSFFGLGIMDGGPDAAFQKGLKDRRLTTRLRSVEGVIIDEISMIPGDALMIAEALAREARESKLPWGGMRVIAVGDFAQLPPVTKERQQRDWAFLNPVWEQSGFQVCLLSHNQRVQDDEFLDVLHDVRHGFVSQRVQNFLDGHVREHDETDLAPRLFPRRAQADEYNIFRLREIPEEEIEIDSIYFGSERHVGILMRSAPVPVKLTLKIGCHVLFLQNDPQKRWVNGTRGQVVNVEPERVFVKKSNGREVPVEKTSFAMQDAEGNTVASVLQYPLTLAYATTIHKSQGATLDDLWCDLGSLWEPGQAYVALSRLRGSEGLRLLRWNSKSVITDSRVMDFYQRLAPVNVTP